MDKSAYELLALLYACETFQRPELIPAPGAVRIDPKFSDALDYLIDCGFVEVNWDEIPGFFGCRDYPSIDPLESTMETLRITRDGIEAVGSGFRRRKTGIPPFRGET